MCMTPHWAQRRHDWGRRAALFPLLLFVASVSLGCLEVQLVDVVVDGDGGDGGDVALLIGSLQLEMMRWVVMTTGHRWLWSTLLPCSPHCRTLARKAAGE